MGDRKTVCTNNLPEGKLVLYNCVNVENNIWWPAKLSFDKELFKLNLTLIGQVGQTLPRALRSEFKQIYPSWNLPESITLLPEREDELEPYLDMLGTAQYRSFFKAACKEAAAARPSASNSFYGDAALYVFVWTAPDEEKLDDALITGTSLGFRSPENKYTPLHVACCFGKVDRVRTLVAHNADCNAGTVLDPDSSTETAYLGDLPIDVFHMNAIEEQIACAKILLPRTTQLLIASDERIRVVTESVIDYGLARVIFGNQEAMTQRTSDGTDLYKAPELRRTAPKKTQPSVKSDVYSLGATLLSLLYSDADELLVQLRELTRAEANIEIAAVFETMTKRYGVQQKDPAWKPFFALIQHCLKYEPDQRPLAREVEAELRYCCELQGIGRD